MRLRFRPLLRRATAASGSSGREQMSGPANWRSPRRYEPSVLRVRARLLNDLQNSDQKFAHCIPKRQSPALDRICDLYLRDTASACTRHEKSKQSPGKQTACGRCHDAEPHHIRRHERGIDQQIFCPGYGQVKRHGSEPAQTNNKRKDENPLRFTGNESVKKRSSPSFAALQRGLYKRQ